MRISSLELINFRNYSKKSFEFDPRTTIYIGPNGIGKTNIIEAIYLLASGSSWRTSFTEEMISFEKEVAHIKGRTQKTQNTQLTRGSENLTIREFDHPAVRSSEYSEFSELQITLTRGSVQSKHTSKILYKIKNIPKRRSDFVGQLKVVLFEPESLEIVIGDPAHRRAYLDEILAQTDPEYARASLIYQKSLRTRNRLLQLIHEGKSNLESLEYWERALVKHGTYVQNKRRELIEWINSRPKGTVSQGQSSRGLSSLELGLILKYDANIISENRLEQYRQNEILAGHTFTGPQRDDFKLQATSNKLQAQDLSSFGSRGEQRMAVFQLKLLETHWIEEKTDPSDGGPIILLDDIFSELDEEHEKIVRELIKNKQAIITATEIHSKHYPQGKIVELI